jgi:NlpC/P60 family putative phage cell wall peptidase
MTSHGQIVASMARGFIGTPYKHQGSNRAGVDCIGLVVAVARDLCLLSDAVDFAGRRIPLADFYNPGYSREPSKQTLFERLTQYLDPVDVEDATLGDLLLFRVAKHPQHVGIITANDPEQGWLITHSFQTMHKVVERDLGARWRQRLVAAFRFRDSAFPDEGEE